MVPNNLHRKFFAVKYKCQSFCVMQKWLHFNVSTYSNSVLLLKALHYTK